MTETQHEGSVAQGREGATRAGGAANDLVDAIGSRYTHWLVPDVEAVELDGGNDVISAVQGLTAVGSGLYFGRHIQFGGDLAGNTGHNVEVLGVDVH